MTRTASAEDPPLAADWASGLGPRTRLQNRAPEGLDLSKASRKGGKNDAAPQEGVVERETMGELAERVEARVNQHAEAAAFLSRSSAELELPERPGFRAVYARAARSLAAAGSQPMRGGGAATEFERRHWTLLDWTRAALVLRALDRLPLERLPTFVLALFERGEIGEQESLLRTLAVLPGPEQYAETALLGCRSNAHRVFEAIACENPYPVRFFSEHAFNQMVLKAIFMEVRASRIEGLATRVTDELVRMVLAYASERQAAGRPTPLDVEFITAERERSKLGPKRES